MHIASMPRVPGARKRRKRVGRGIGSGHGKTSTRGQKGQRARTGKGKRPGFEGGRTPFIRQIPKRGFKQKATGAVPVREIINVDRLNHFQDGQRIAPEQLAASGLIHDAAHQIKLLGEGELTKKLTIAVHAVSESAKAKVTKAGGTIELIERVALGSPARPSSNEPGRAGLKAQGKSPQPPAPSPQQQ